MLHWIGALLIIVSCAAIGFSMAAAHRKEETALRDLLQALEYMASDLQFRLTPLPELCRKAAASPKNAVGKVLKTLSAELEHQICPDVSSCMHAALFRCSDIKKCATAIDNPLKLFGGTLVAAMLSVTAGGAMYLALGKYMGISSALTVASVGMTALVFVILAVKFGAVKESDLTLLPAGDKLCMILKKTKLI